MIPVEIKLNDFEEYIKTTRHYIRTMLFSVISSSIILATIAVLCKFGILGVVIALSLSVFALIMTDATIFKVIKSYKTAKLFYKSLYMNSFTPVSSKPMLVEGFFNRDKLIYIFKCKVLS